MPVGYQAPYPCSVRHLFGPFYPGCMNERQKRIRRPRLVLALLIVLGVAAIGFGWIVAPEGFPSSLLLEVGAGLVLFAFLLMLERTLVRSFEASIEEAKAESRESVGEIRGRIEEVEESVAEVRSEVARLGEIGAETRRAIAERQGEIERTFEEFAGDVSPGAISGILSVAERLNAIDPAGVRVWVDDTWLRLRFRDVGSSFDQSIDVTIEEYDGTEIDQVHWADQTAHEVMLEVVEKLQAHGRYSAEVQPDIIFERLRDTVRTAVELRTQARRGPGDLPPMVEIPNDQWAVTTEGVGCLERNYFVDNGRFNEDDWSAHMSEKTWVDYDKFRVAFDVAKAIWEREKRERIEWEKAPF